MDGLRCTNIGIGYLPNAWVTPGMFTFVRQGLWHPVYWGGWAGRGSVDLTIMVLPPDPRWWQPIYPPQGSGE